MHDVSVLSQQVLLNLVAAPLFVFIFGLVPEPWRQRVNTGLVLVAALVYFGGGLGGWEYVFGGLILGCAVWGWRFYPALGVGWLLHTLNDVFHHSAGLPMVETIPLSSFGCAIFDPLIAIWFFFHAPSVKEMYRGIRGRLTPNPAPLAEHT